MNVKKSPKKGPLDLCLDPEKRICPEFDAVSIKKYANDQAGTGVTRVLDNCAEEHIM